MCFHYEIWMVIVSLNWQQHAKKIHPQISFDALLMPRSLTANVIWKNSHEN